MTATRLPRSLRADIERGWGEHLGRSVRIAATSSVSGGCVSRVARIATDAGDVAFLKWDEGAHARRMLAEEARSLRVLQGTHAVHVPDVLATGPAREAEALAPWLLLEWLEPAPPSDTGWHALGTELARLHHRRAPAIGWEADNFIGSLPQRNPAGYDWPSFWRDHRLEPQLRLAEDAGRLQSALRHRFDRLLQRLGEILAVAAEEGPSLLHGDLWNGNVHHFSGERAALIDPSSYYGHREVDLAMTQLFGGFPHTFYAAYQEAWALLPGYRERRRPVYQLYYLLVHVNLFGGGYLSATSEALERAGF